MAGGGEIYRQAMPFADQLSVTHVAVKLDGDTFFRKSIPAFLRKPRKPRSRRERDNYPVLFTTYVRRAASK